jgi:hypothetical protein
VASSPVTRTNVACVSSAVEAAVRVALERLGGSQVRRCYSGPDRAQIEMRGLRDTPGRDLGDAATPCPWGEKHRFVKREKDIRIRRLDYRRA